MQAEAAPSRSQLEAKVGGPIKSRPGQQQEVAWKEQSSGRRKKKQHIIYISTLM